MANEYDLWLAETKKSEYQWMLDEITRLNKGDLLLYKGGMDGIFIEIQKDGLLLIGKYEGAIPHIGDAIFTTTAKKQFENQDKAIQRAVNVGGLDFLLAFFR